VPSGVVNPNSAEVLGVRATTRANPPQQEVRPRASTLVESRNGATRQVSHQSEALWREWDAELGAEIDLGKPVPNAKPAAAPRAPLPPLRAPHVPAPTQALWGSANEAPATRERRPEVERISTSRATPSLAAPRAPVSERGPSAPETMSATPAAVTVPEADYRGHRAWAVELAHAELKMERSGEVDVSAPQQRHEILRSRTNEYLLKLFESFRRDVEVFNEARRSPGQSIHVYRVSNTESDFMLFRNGVKLVVSGAKAGRVVFAFNQYLGQIFGPNQSPTLELEANFGAFDQLTWAYRGERVQIEDVCRYFLAEFVRQSFR